MVEVVQLAEMVLTPFGSVQYQPKSSAQYFDAQAIHAHAVACFLNVFSFLRGWSRFYPSLVREVPIVY